MPLHTCKNCNGTGKVVCDECGGEGELGFELAVLETAKLNPRGKHFDELLALKNDAARVRSDAQRLIEIVPGRAESYRAQMEGALAVIELRAEKLWREHV